MREGFNRFARTLALGGALATGAGATEGCNDDKRPVEPHTEHSTQNTTEDFFTIPLDQPLDSIKKQELIDCFYDSKQDHSAVLKKVQAANMTPIEMAITIQQVDRKNVKFIPLRSSQLDLLLFESFKSISFKNTGIKIFRNEILRFKSNDQGEFYEMDNPNNNKLLIQKMLQEMGYSNSEQQLAFLDRESQKTGDKLRDLTGIQGETDAQTEKEIEQLQTYLNKIGELKEAL